jgi:hypothetical protein
LGRSGQLRQAGYLRWRLSELCDGFSRFGDLIEMADDGFDRGFITRFPARICALDKVTKADEITIERSKSNRRKNLVKLPHPGQDNCKTSPNQPCQSVAYSLPTSNRLFGWILDDYILGRSSGRENVLRKL